METNFNLMEKVLRDIKNTNSKTYRYLRDFNFFLIETEKHIYYRKLIQANYTLRMLSDLSKQFIYHLIKDTDNSLMNKWEENIKDRMKSIRESYKKRRKTYKPTNPGFNTLFDEYPSNVENYVEGIGDIKTVLKTLNEMNSWMHYVFDTNYFLSNDASNDKDKSTLYIHRGQIRYSKPSMEKSIKYLSTIWFVTLKVIKMSSLNESYKIPNFNKDIYLNPEFVLNKFKENSIVNEYINKNKKCPICREGYFKLPDLSELKEKNVTFPYGAYLSCSTEGCWAKLDDSLKIKREMKYDKQLDSTCPICRKENSLQQRVNLKIDVNCIYKACKKCDWNDKKIDSEEINDIINSDEYNWEDNI